MKLTTSVDKILHASKRKLTTVQSNYILLSNFENRQQFPIQPTNQ